MEKLPWYLKVTAWFNRYIPPFRWLAQWITHGQLKRLAQKPDGTLHWIREGDSGRIRAFYGSLDAYRQIPGWDVEMPSLDHDTPYTRLDHGYEETRLDLTRVDLTLEDLTLEDHTKEDHTMEDLHQAAVFRGGQLKTPGWDGNMHLPVKWRCCQGHTFSMTPHAVLKGGHWCLECISPPWNYKVLTEKNPFAAQVLDAPDRDHP